VSGLLAHGGIGGAIVEISLVLSILLIFAAVWRRSRNASADEAEQEPKGEAGT
jgi:hypothetical protein